MLSTKLKEAAGNSADATLYVDDVFCTYLYTGNGSTQTITNGIDLAGKGGLVWTKVRTTTYPHCLTDTIRGGNKQLFSNTTDASITSSPAEISSFNSDGYTLAGNTIENWSGQNFVGWTFREAAKFFDVVTWTGNGSARTIAHSLGVAPGMIIVKRTDTSSDWQVYHRSLTSAAYSTQLNLNNAQASAPTVWNSTAPTSSVFSVGTDATVNASGGTYVAYLYAHDTSSTGIIQCGSFTTNSSTDSFVSLGWQPQYVLVKNTAVGGWILCDSMRGMPVGSADAYLMPNSANAESTSNDYINPSATGFYPTWFNLNTTSTYIYMAIRMPNKPPTTGTQVFLPATRAGTGATATTSNLSFPLDMVWSKGRDNGGTNSGDFDRLRGATYQLSLNQADGDISASTSLTGFDVMTGYRAGADAVQLTINATGYNYINWNFKRAPGFFDEVCYTGTGSATTQAHNLTVVPEMILINCRSNPRNWPVYTGNKSSYLYLNLTDSQVTGDTAIWSNTAPTSTNFSLGTYSTNNASITLPS